jgi:hypothetical protein
MWIGRKKSTKKVKLLGIRIALVDNKEMTKLNLEEK